MEEYIESDIIVDDSGDIDLSTGKRVIRTKSSDPTIEVLHAKYQRGKLNIQPSYQRQYVWDAKKASLLIESVLLDIPIPIIYLAQNEDGIENVIDGQQRLTSLFCFIEGKFPDGKVFKLTGLNVFGELKGKTYKDLDDDKQEKIRDYSLRVISFTNESDPDLQYEIFQRLNTGSVALNDQELRNCIYRGKFNELLKELTDNEDFRFITGIQQPHSRMKDVEMVLRFIAFRNATYLNYNPPIKKFLNDTMRKHRNIDDVDAKQIRENFKRACANTRSLLGDKAFRRFVVGESDHQDGHWEKQLNISLYDIVMDSMSRVEPPVLMRHLDAVREAYINVISTNDAMISAITWGTSDKPTVTKRFTLWNDIINGIIADDKADERCFSRSLKQKLYDNDPTCAICGQYIADIDDSAVDHIEQYWKGGKTIPDNARLTHRYCNCARPKDDIV